MQAPDWQLSGWVQALPSLQDVPFGALLAWHCPVGLQESGAVQVLLVGLPHGEPAASYWQVEEQQSPFWVFPSSHCSPASAVPLPQTATAQTRMLHPAGPVQVTVMLSSCQ